MNMVYPEAFLEVRVEGGGSSLPYAGLCAGYDGGSWRCSQFADHLFNWIPFAGLSQEDQHTFRAHNFVELLSQASAHIYQTKKSAARGEIGELILHSVCINHYKTIPVLCKLILKTSPNEVIKGFDGVHILPVGETFEIWLGESKFYRDGKKAIRDAIQSVRQHILPAFLKTEKAMIFGHIGVNTPHRDKLAHLFRKKTSSDDLLRMSVFPILIAYESNTVAQHRIICDQYVSHLESEINILRDYFTTKSNNLLLRFRLILIPVKSKRDLIAKFDRKLEAFL